MKWGIEDQIKEVARELALRRNVYPGFVSRGKMREAEAAEHIEKLDAVLETLKWLREHRDRVIAAGGSVDG